MAKSLVDNPDSVTVTEVEGETTVLELRVAPEDMGKLIGRQGRIAKEIRTIVKSVVFYKNLCTHFILLDYHFYGSANLTVFHGIIQKIGGNCSQVYTSQH